MRQKTSWPKRAPATEIQPSNSVYKIYACLLHARLKAAIDDRISPVQFGFRAGRSTSTPLFVLRRLLELHERHQESFFALFLDWSQAFDSVSHNALCNALSRFGIPPQFAEPILSIYHDCHFKVKDAGHFFPIQALRTGHPTRLSPLPLPFRYHPLGPVS